MEQAHNVDDRSASIQRRDLAIITGANGGMGRACARQLGATTDLVLTDVSPSLKDFTRELELEGYTVRATVVGNFCSAEVIDALASHASVGFDALVHTCGLPPSADWRQIFNVNYVATVRLLDVLTPLVRENSAAVLIASVAGHLSPEIAEVEAILANPLSPTLLDDVEPVLRQTLGAAAERALGTLSYAISKKKVIDLCESRAAPWGTKGGRIVSISPGMIYTPMGRQEASLDETAEAQVKSAPAGRWGTAAEIAAAAGFLLSPTARFITGCDLRVDGGAMGAIRASGGTPWIDVLRERMS